MTDSLTIAKTCAEAAFQIHAEDIVVLDLRQVSSLTDYFVICTASSVPHLKAVVRDVRKQIEESLEELPHSTDGDANSLWVVMDYIDVVVHIFHTSLREVYSLENLWSDAPRVPLDLPDSPQALSGRVG